MEAGLVTPIYSWGSMGCYTADTFAYLIRRPADGATGQDMVELGVCAYGPGGDRLAGEVADRIRAWGQARDALAGLRVEVWAGGAAQTTAYRTGLIRRAVRRRSSRRS